MRGLFPGTASLPDQSSKIEQHTQSVTTRWPTNINVVPIDYAFRPRLRDRLTLRRLALRRNPWTFGGSVSHTPFRYSCQHSHFCGLQEPLRVSLRRLAERSATTQRTEDRRRTPDPTRGFTRPCRPSSATCARSSDIRHATVSRRLRRCIRGRAHNAPTLASHRSNRSPFAESV